jgi:hypothetical protein
MNQVAVVIPAYNESKTIRDVVQRALVQCQHIIVIDDGSIDGTASMIADLPVVLLRNDRNRGKAASLWRGMQHATDRGATVFWKWRENIPSVLLSVRVWLTGVPSPRDVITPTGWQISGYLGLPVITSRTVSLASVYIPRVCYRIPDCV